ncbi:MAG: trypsin-like serine protease [Betaproteobacteria bacterium]|nr:trypsin-like serine protease [Betaproteobacteria bacterium]
MRNLWLVFAQTATVALAVLFVIATLHPEWLGRDAAGDPAARVMALREAVPSPAGPGRANSYRDAVNKAVPAVVNVYTSKEVRAPRHPLLNDPLFHQFFGDRSDDRPQRSRGLGSGVIVSANGYILTNQHVIEGADEIEVALADGRKLRAKSVGSDPETDLAVLQVDAGSVPAITFGDDSALSLGDVVLAIGNPFGVGQTVTMGIVSGMGRTPGINTFENFIQTDAAINPGNSGGALIDTAGNLVGINTAIYSRTGGSLGIGFAIPAASARKVLESIIATGSVTRGWIGVESSEITTELAASLKLAAKRGTLIAGVIRGGPADKAGIRPGDILTAVAGRQVRDQASMLELVAALPPGKPAMLILQRNRTEFEAVVAVGQRPIPQPRR